MNALTDRQRLVAVEDLPEYPIPAEERLDSHSFFFFHHAWWQNSRFKMRADLEVKGAFLELICAAQREAPVGTLPLDEDLLAKMADVSLEKWRQLVARPVGPLYGWAKCRCDDGQVKLFHAKVLEVAQQAMRGRTANAEKREADRERKRIEAMPRQILRAGGSARLGEDEAYKIQLDQFLLTHFSGRSRTIAVMREAMECLATGEIPARAAAAG